MVLSKEITETKATVCTDELKEIYENVFPTVAKFVHSHGITMSLLYLCHLAKAKLFAYLVPLTVRPSAGAVGECGRAYRPASLIIKRSLW